MNVHPSPKQFETATAQIDSLAAERGLLGRLLMRPELISEVSGRITAADFSHRANGLILDTMLRLSKEGRSPSLMAIGAVHGDEEIEPGFTFREYLNNLFTDSIHAPPAPLDDAIGVILDAVRREQASALGSSLSFAAMSSGVSLREALNDTIERADDILASFRASENSSYDLAGAGARALAHMRGDAPGYPTTGLTDLDHILGGWPRGQLSILAGRPGMGKTAAAVSSMLKGAKAGHATLFFNLEMTGVQLGSRLLTDLAYINTDPIYYQDIIKRRVLQDRHARRLDDAQELLRSLPVMIEEKDRPPLGEVTARARKVANHFDKQGRRLETIFIDHMLLLGASSRYAGSRVNEVREFAEGLKGLAAELDVSVVALCQLNRGVEGRDNKRPGLSDLKESGAIEEMASAIVFLFRPEYYLQRREDTDDDERDRLEALEKVKNRLEYDVAKNRNGETGHVTAWADIGCNAIRNRSFGTRA